MPKRILSTSRNATVLRTRNLVLQSAGYDVTTTRDPKEFTNFIKKESFDAVVMGDSIDLAERVELASKIAASKPNLPLVIFFKTPAEAQQLLPYAHSLVGSLDGPERLIAAVQGAVQKNKHNKPRRRPHA